MLLTISFHLKQCITLFLFLIISGGEKQIFFIHDRKLWWQKSIENVKIISAGDYLVYLDKWGLRFSITCFNCSSVGVWILLLWHSMLSSFGSHFPILNSARSARYLIWCCVLVYDVLCCYCCCCCCCCRPTFLEARRTQRRSQHLSHF